MQKAFPMAAIIAILMPIAALAETGYVTDNLRLGLHQASDTSDRAFRTLDSGQELEIISRDRNYANVRLPDGVVGFVKAAYLVFDKPAKLIVAETQAANDALRQELEDTKAAFAAPAATIETLEQRLAESESMAETGSSWKIIEVGRISTNTACPSPGSVVPCSCACLAVFLVGCGGSTRAVANGTVESEFTDQLTRQHTSCC